MITDISYTKLVSQNLQPLTGAGVPMKLYQYVDLDSLIDRSNCHRFQFIDVNGKGLTYTRIDFSSCLFQRAYFHKAKFINCNFTGARFSECNFRGADFYGCTFDFADFDKTII